MVYIKVFFVGLLMLVGQMAFAQWLDISDVTSNRIVTEHNGPMLEISYELGMDDITVDNPAYVFIRYSQDGGNSWKSIDPLYLQGEGSGIVSSPGQKKVVVWGIRRIRT